MSCDDIQCFRVKTLATLCGVSTRTVERWRADQYIPSSLQIRFIRELIAFYKSLPDDGLDKDLQVLEHFGAKLPVGLQGSRTR